MNIERLVEISKKYFDGKNENIDDLNRYINDINMITDVRKLVERKVKTLIDTYITEDTNIEDITNVYNKMNKIKAEYIHDINIHNKTVDNAENIINKDLFNIICKQMNNMFIDMTYDCIMGIFEEIEKITNEGDVTYSFEAKVLILFQFIISSNRFLYNNKSNEVIDRETLINNFPNDNIIYKNMKLIINNLNTDDIIDHLLKGNTKYEMRKNILMFKEYIVPLLFNGKYVSNEFGIKVVEKFGYLILTNYYFNKRIDVNDIKYNLLYISGNARDYIMKMIDNYEYSTINKYKISLNLGLRNNINILYLNSNVWKGNNKILKYVPEKIKIALNGLEKVHCEYGYINIVSKNNKNNNKYIKLSIMDAAILFTIEEQGKMNIKQIEEIFQVNADITNLVNNDLIILHDEDTYSINI